MSTQQSEMYKVKLAGTKGWSDSDGDGYEYPHTQSFSIGIEACDSSQLLDFEDLSTYGFDIADAEVDLSHHYLVVKHNPSDDWEYWDLLEEMTR